MKQTDNYGEAKVMEYEGAVVRVYHPILTPEERERRFRQIAKAAASLLMSEERRKEHDTQDSI